MDPMAGSKRQPLTLNRYLYGNDDPIGMIDPTGRMGTEDAVILGGVAGVLVGAVIVANPRPAATVMVNVLGALVERVCVSMSMPMAWMDIIAAQPKHHTPEQCRQEWDDAYDMCCKELAKPNPNRGITGGHTNVRDCARGHVSEDCGGNPVDYGPNAPN